MQSRSLFWLCVWSYDSDEAEHTCGRDLCSGYVCGVMIQMKLNIRAGRDLCSGYVCGVMIQMKLNIRAVEISVLVMCVEL